MTTRDTAPRDVAPRDVAPREVAPRDGAARAAPDRAVTLDVSILGRDYRIACKESERAELLQAVTFLDRRMREIRDQGKVSGPDRIAVMAALNIAHDLLRDKSRHARGDTTPRSASEPAIDGGSAQRRIRDMGTAIDSLLASQDKLF
ncbi:MAG TPA: cell division protein ZapA [Casimicrobiaceae bacterium]|jgi:cell division protein ZapA|nr:cell division protein ZapA [Casimicrobiaceae bacterium]